MVIRRGDVWWADLGPPRGSAPALRRPVVVVSADEYNASRLRTAVVAILTRNLALARAPGNALLAAEAGPLEHDSVVNVTQLTTVDESELLERLGALPDWLMAQVDAGLSRALSLR